MGWKKLGDSKWSLKGKVGAGVGLNSSEFWYRERGNQQYPLVKVHSVDFTENSYLAFGCGIGLVYGL